MKEPNMEAVNRVLSLVIARQDEEIRVLTKQIKELQASAERDFEKDGMAVENNRLRTAINILLPFAEYQLGEMTKVWNPEPLKRAIKIAEEALSNA